MGGIIARGVASKLLEYKDRFGFFMTLSTPHLGLNFVQNFLFNLGFFFLKVVRKTQSVVNQLSLKDAKSINETFLFELSKDDSLKYFEQVLFVGSLEDHYSPYESSLVVKGKILGDKGSKEVCQMLENLQSTLKKT